MLPRDNSLPKTYFDMLEIAPTKEMSAIKKSYRELALKYHPDKVRQRMNSASPAEIDDAIKEANAQFNKVDTAFKELERLSLNNELADYIDAITANDFSRYHKAQAPEPQAFTFTKNVDSNAVVVSEPMITVYFPIQVRDDISGQYLDGNNHRFNIFPTKGISKNEIDLLSRNWQGHETDLPSDVLFDILAARLTAFLKDIGDFKFKVGCDPLDAAEIQWENMNWTRIVHTGMKDYNKPRQTAIAHDSYLIAEARVRIADLSDRITQVQFKEKDSDAPYEIKEFMTLKKGTIIQPTAIIKLYDPRDYIPDLEYVKIKMQYCDFFNILPHRGLLPPVIARQGIDTQSELQVVQQFLSNKNFWMQKVGHVPQEIQDMHKHTEQYQYDWEFNQALYSFWQIANRGIPQATMGDKIKDLFSFFSSATNPDLHIQFYRSVNLKTTNVKNIAAWIRQNAAAALGVPQTTPALTSASAAAAAAATIQPAEQRLAITDNRNQHALFQSSDDRQATNVTNPANNPITEQDIINQIAKYETCHEALQQNSSEPNQKAYNDAQEELQKMSARFAEQQETTRKHHPS